MKSAKCRMQILGQTGDDGQQSEVRGQGSGKGRGRRSGVGADLCVRPSMDVDESPGEAVREHDGVPKYHSAFRIEMVSAERSEAHDR